MKKFIVTFVVIFTAIIAMARTEQIVIKNGEVVTIYNIRDLGENVYGNKDFEIEVSRYTNPTIRDLKSCDVPEEAWKMCSMSENGVYSSRLYKLSQAMQEIKSDYQNEMDKNEKLEATNTQLKIFLTLAVLLFAGLLIHNLYRLVIGKKSAN